MCTVKNWEEKPQVSTPANLIQGIVPISPPYLRYCYLNMDLLNIYVMYNPPG
jgi:hypothetical protein